MAKPIIQCPKNYIEQKEKVQAGYKIKFLSEINSFLTLCREYIMLNPAHDAEYNNHVTELP